MLAGGILVDDGEGVSGKWELTPRERLQIAGLYAMIVMLDCRLCNDGSCAVEVKATISRDTFDEKRSS